MNTYFTLLILSSVLSLVGFFWLVIVAFKRSVLWGLLVLLFSPISAIVFSMVNWFDARKAFIVYMLTFLLFGGTIVFILGQVGVGNMQQIATELQTGKLKPDKAYQLVDKVLRQGNSENLFAEESPAAVAPPSMVKPSPGQVPVAATVKPDTQPVQHQSQIAIEHKPVVPNKAKSELQAAQPVAVAMTKTKPVTDISTSQTATDKQSNSDTDPQADPEVPPNMNNVPPDPLEQKIKPQGPDTVAVSLSRISGYIGHYFIITLKTGSQHRGLLRRVEKTRLVLERKLYGGKFVYQIRKDEIRSIRLLKKIPSEEE